MYQDRIVLTSRDILEKEFKIDTRGYRPQEVDRYLDIIIKDYEEMRSIINDLERDKKELLEDNIRLKQEIRNYSFVELGKKYNVSDNAIRKWCKFYNLPSKRKEIKSYTNEEWEKI